MSVVEADVVKGIREGWQETIKGDGGYCPCCDRWGKVNQKRIHKAMANDLLWLYQESKKHPVGTAYV